MIVPGFPHHIVQRGHNRQPVFVERQFHLNSSIDVAFGWSTGSHSRMPSKNAVACCRYVELNPVAAGGARTVYNRLKHKRGKSTFEERSQLISLID